MIHRAKDLSPEEKAVVENLLGRSISPAETISVRAVPAAATPEWLRESWESAEQQGLDQLSMEEIDAEIAAARKTRRENRSEQ
jgi:hypothetical protein